MLSPLRNRFGIPGVISVIALVFAMFGGAYAATNSGGGKATASAKAKKGPRGPKGPKGDTGPAGLPGAQGPAGPAGKDGTNGTDGADGTDGKDGKDGPAGPLLDTLPSGKSLTGAWSFFGEEEFLSISYQFKLASPLAKTDIVFVKEGEGETAACPGTEAEPKAAAGKLCVYAFGTEVNFVAFSLFPHSTTAGAVLFLTSSEGFAFGTWALKAP